MTSNMKKWEVSLLYFWTVHLSPVRNSDAEISANSLFSPVHPPYRYTGRALWFIMYLIWIHLWIKLLMLPFCQVWLIESKSTFGGSIEGKGWSLTARTCHVWEISNSPFVFIYFFSFCYQKLLIELWENTREKTQGPLLPECEMPAMFGTVAIKIDLN